MPQTNLTKAKLRATKIGVEIKPSKRKHKKLDVFRNDQYVVSIGDKRYSDFLQHNDEERKRRYKTRHEKNRHKLNSAGYFADKILWS